MTKLRIKRTVGHILFLMIFLAALLPILLRLTGCTGYSVKDDAMSPVISKGSLVYAWTKPAESLKCGEWIVFLSAPSTVSVGQIEQAFAPDAEHFIVKCRMEQNRSAVIHKNNILGCIRLTIPYLGALNDRLDEGSNRMILLAASFVALLLFYLAALFRK